MRLQRTAKIRLHIHPEALRDSVNAYTKAFNHVCRYGWDNNVTSSMSLQKATYAHCRGQLGLPAQLACSVAVKAAEAIKSAKARLKAGRKASCPQSKHCSIRYDARSYTLFLESGKVSLLTTNGRIKTNLLIPDHFHQYLDWKHASADLVSSSSRKWSKPRTTALLLVWIVESRRSP